MKKIILLLLGCIGSLQALTPQQQKALAEKFAPLVKLAANDVYTPTSIFYYVKRSALKKGNQIVTPQGLISIQMLGTLTNKKDGYRLAPNMPSVGKGSPIVNGLAQAECYVNFIQKPYIRYRQPNGEQVVLQDGGIVMQYIFFYPGNASIAPAGVTGVLSPAFKALDAGIHEGDWEHIDVHLKKWGRGTSVNDYVLDKVYVARHQSTKGDVLTANQIPKFNGTHPIIYSAQNSHASYYQNQTTLNDDFDKTDANGPQWRTWEHIRIIGPKDKPYPGMEWINFAGRWGMTTKTSTHGDSPVGAGVASWYRNGPNDFIRKVAGINANMEKVGNRTVLRENAAYRKIKNLVQKIGSVDTKIKKLQNKLSSIFGTSKVGKQVTTNIQVVSKDPMVFQKALEAGDPDALLIQAIWSPDIQRAQQALDKGADINGKTSYFPYALGWTPLHYAVDSRRGGFSFKGIKFSQYQLNMVTWLRQHGANPNITDDRGITPRQAVFQTRFRSGGMKQRIINALDYPSPKVVFNKVSNPNKEEFMDLNYHINIGKTLKKGFKEATKGGKKIATKTIGGIDKAVKWTETTVEETADVTRTVATRIGTGDFKGAAQAAYAYAKSILQNFEAALRVAEILARIAKLQAEKVVLLAAVKLTRAEGSIRRNSNFVKFSSTAARFGKMLWIWKPEGTDPFPMGNTELATMIINQGMTSVINKMQDIQFYIYRRGEHELVEDATKWLGAVGRFVWRADIKRQGPIFKGDIVTTVIGPNDNQYYIADLKRRSGNFGGKLVIYGYGVEL